MPPLPSSPPPRPMQVRNSDVRIPYPSSSPPPLTPMQVRNSGVRTLFLAICSNGTKLPATAWREVREGRGGRGGGDGGGEGGGGAQSDGTKLPPTSGARREGDGRGRERWG